MKKITLLLFLALTSCGIEYDGETRLISETTVLDRNGNFLSGVEIKIRASNGSDEDIISNGFSDSYGNTRLIFAPPKNASLEITFSKEQSGYDTKSFHNVKISDFDNFRLVMDEIILLKTDDVINLELQFENSFTTNKTLFDSRIEGLISGRDFFNRDENFLGYPVQSNFSVAKNQTVVVHYTLIDQITNEKTEHLLPISIENENVSQTITY